MLLHYLDILTRYFEEDCIWDLLIKIKGRVYWVHGVYLLKWGLIYLKYLPDQVPCIGVGVTQSEHPSSLPSCGYPHRLYDSSI